MGSVSNQLTPATEWPPARVHPPRCSVQFLVRAGSSLSTHPPPSMYAGTGPGAPSLPSPGVFQVKLLTCILVHCTHKVTFQVKNKPTKIGFAYT